MSQTSTSRADLVGAFTTALAFASSDTTIPPMCGIQLSIHKNRLVFASTDRVKAALVRVELEPQTTLEDRSLGFIEYATARKVLGYIKAVGALRKLPVQIELNERSIAFAAGDGSQFVHLLSGIAERGPDIIKVIQERLDAAPGPTAWSANADYLAKFRIAKRSSGEHISLRPTADRRGVVAVIGDHFLGVLMVVRETAPIDERLSEWQEYLKPSPKPRAPRKTPAKKAAPRKSPARKTAARSKKAAA